MLMTTPPMLFITRNRCKCWYISKTSQNLNKRFNWHNFCSRNSTAYSTCNVLMAHFLERSQSFTKTSHTLLVLLGDLRKPDEEIGINYVAKPILKTKERYWMHKFRTIVPYNLNGKAWDECSADTYINFATEFSSV